MDRSAKAAARIEVLWRPGCPYCSRLRSRLRQAGISPLEHDIWRDPAAAARLRAMTGGDETVPTVVIGSRALVNPSVRDVVTAVCAEFPDEADHLVGPAPAASRPSRSGTRAPVLGTLAVGPVWVALAMWRPTTTWHLAPMLLAAAAPWVLAQDLRAGDQRALPRLATAAVAGLIVSSLITWMLATTGLPRGPTLPGFPDPRTESLLLAGAGAVLAGLLGARRALRRPSPTRSAWLGEELIARSDDVVLGEGNAYSLASDVRPGALTPTSTRTVCPWKGIARYYTVAVDGTGIHDAAWSCPQPLPLTRRVKGRVAFGNAVQIWMQ